MIIVHQFRFCIDQVFRTYYIACIHTINLFFLVGVWNFFVKREQSKFIYFAECRKNLTLVNSLFTESKYQIKQDGCSAKIPGKFHILVRGEIDYYCPHKGKHKQHHEYISYFGIHIS